MLDRILSVGPGYRLTALKNVSVEPWSPGSAGCQAALPNALVLESMTQAAGALAWFMELGDENPLTEGRRQSISGLLAGIDHCRIHGCAAPGDQLILKARLGRRKAGFGRFHCRAEVAGKPIGRAEIALRSEDATWSGSKNG